LTAALEALSLLKTIRAIPGFKVVTLVGQVSGDSFSIESDGRVGVASFHEDVFLRHVRDNLMLGAALVIRQRIPQTGKLQTLENGERALVYACAVYAAFLGRGAWFPDIQRLERLLRWRPSSGR